MTATSAELGAWIIRGEPGGAGPPTAAGPDATLPLAGARLTVKDNIDVAGIPTTAGHPAYAYTPETSAEAVRRLVDAGARVVGKTNLDQFATGLVGTRSPFGPGRNPWDPDRIAGGSSAGSAIAVATGDADLALSTDTAGSGRVPAALCGVVGLKPARGLVSTTGVVPAIRGLDCVGVMAPTVAVAARALALLAGYDRCDPWSRPLPAGTPVIGTGRPRIGVPERVPGLDAHARRAWAAALDRLDAIAVVEPVDVSAYLEAGTLLYGGALVAARWQSFGRFLDAHPDGADATVAAIVAGAGTVPAHQLVADLDRLRDLRRQVDEAWEGLDAVALPTVGEAPTLAEVAADPVGVNTRLGRWTNGTNLVDRCAAAVPCGTRDDGVPFGVSLLGPAFADAVVAAVGARLMGEPDPPPPAWSGWATIVVVGAHLSGQPLNRELTDRGAKLIAEVTTAASYRLYALPTDPPKPGLVRVNGAGHPIAGELWTLPVDRFGQFVLGVGSPLSIGTVQLADGSAHPGFLCEPWVLDGAEDITSHGGWLAWRRSGASR